MRIYIPSMGRVEIQPTLSQLPHELKSATTLVVPTEERIEYERWGVDVIGVNRCGIVETRDYILKHAMALNDDKFVMLDDDLVFQRRRSNMKITNASQDEVFEAFLWLSDQLNEVAHAGFGTRFLSYDATEDYASPGRMMYVLGYNTGACIDARAYFGKGLEQYSTMEDFNMTLQLLTRGYTNRISLEWRVAPRKSNAAGGCSTWRTAARQTESAKRLAAMYPGLVRVRPKRRWQGMDDQPEMYDVQVQWKKALESYGETV